LNPALNGLVREARLRDGRLGMALCRKCGFMWEVSVDTLDGDFMPVRRMCKCKSSDVEVTRTLMWCLTPMDEEAE
jgi:elongation factor P hydroxylase